MGLTHLVGAGLLVCALMAWAPTADGRAVYATNLGTGAGSGQGSVSQYSMGSDGSLAPQATPTLPAGNGSAAIALSPGGGSAYVSNGFTAAASAVSQYSIGSAGALDALSPPSVGSAWNSGGAAVSPNGRWAYVVTWTPGVFQYSISEDGGLSALSPASVSTGSTTGMSVGSTAIAVTPSGDFAYVLNANADDVSQFAVSASGGLVPLSPTTVPSGSGPAGIAISPSGGFAYVTNWRDDTVSVFSIGVNGRLQAAGTVTLNSGTSPQDIAVSPSGKYAYVANNGAGTVSAYSVGGDGALTPLPVGGTAATGNGPSDIALSPSGESAYVTNAGLTYEGNTVSQYSVASDGSLQPMSSPSVAAGTSPSSVVVQPAQGPRAALTVTAVGSGADIFDASATTFVDVPVQKTWTFDFGDGSVPIESASPTVSHEYAGPGSYTVTVVAASDGCSTQPIVFTGQTAYCDGSQLADFSRAVEVTTVPGGTIVTPGNAGGQSNGNAIPANNVALKFHLSGKDKQKLASGGVAVDVECDNSDCNVDLHAQGTVGGKKFAFKAVKESLEIGKKRVVHLHFASRKSFRQLKKLLKAERKTMKVSVSGIATGDTAAASTKPEKSKAEFVARVTR